MSIHQVLANVTRQITERSADTRAEYLDRMQSQKSAERARAHLTCGNQAHAFAGAGQDQNDLAEGHAPNIGIVTAYNDMLSAHQPYATYPDLIRATARTLGATAQVAGGVPAMCDGVTQGQPGMELSLFSRDVIALSATIALSHNCYDAALYLGICDKIVPGLVMAAAEFGHLPAAFVPAGPMSSGLPNDEKARVRTDFAAGNCDRKALMAAEMASYHGAGTCTFYGTANTNQMLMEFIGLQLPGSSFVSPDAPLRPALTRAVVARVLAADAAPVAEILSEKSFVNALVGLMATGGSTNLILHLPVMARVAGIILRPEDFAAISEVTPLLTRIYPNGLADINHFHAAGGTGYLIRTLLDAGLLHEDVETLAGSGLRNYTKEPRLKDGEVCWEDAATESLNEKILRPADRPFSATGGLRALTGNFGDGVIKISAVPEASHVIKAPARVFDNQDAVKTAFRNKELDGDCVVVVRFQGPRANGMPELHGLTPILSVLQARGYKVALVTDGRMSGASGKVPAAIHISPEAARGGAIARIADGDIIILDAIAGTLTVSPEALSRPPADGPASRNAANATLGRGLFERFRANASDSISGGSPLI